MAHLPFAFSLAALFALAAWWQRALTASGALGATLVGGLVFAFGRWPAAGALLAFFITSSALSRLGAGRKAGVLVDGKGAQRDLAQVLANGGSAAAAVVLGRLQPEAGWGSAFLGAVAAAAADTWATEVGLLSPTPPRLITTLRPTTPGRSGGVSALGLAAAVGGALAVGGAYATLGGAPWGRSVRTALLGGLAGTLLDSLLGATAQGGYYCPRCRRSTERRVHGCGAETALRHGLRWVDNDVVNLAGTLAGGLVGRLAR